MKLVFLRDFLCSSSHTCSFELIKCDTFTRNMCTNAYIHTLSFISTAGILREYVYKAAQTLGFSALEWGKEKSKEWFPNKFDVQKVLFLLCWELGGTMEGGGEGGREGGTNVDKALKVFCACCKAESFAPYASLPSSTAPLADSVADIVSNTFLYIMSRLHR